MDNFSDNYDKILYCDLDGVIVGFNLGFSKLPNSDGLLPDQYEEIHGKESAWDVIDSYGKDKFFSELPWEPSGGEKLWRFIEDNFVNVKILTALGNRESPDNFIRKGKRKWLNINIPSLSDDDIIMVPNKHAKKHHAKPGDILIDDTLVCIEEWNGKKGIGILHTDLYKTLTDLRKHIL